MIIRLVENMIYPGSSAVNSKTSIKNGWSEKQLGSIRLSDRIYDLITERIIEGSIRYGDSLNIKQIAEELQVSPMPVRDAIKRLESEGLVVVRPQSKCYVRIPTQESMLNAFELRSILEIASLDKIYRTVRPKDLENMKEYLERMEQCVPGWYDSDQMREYVKYDQLFHREICVLTGNEYVVNSHRYALLHLNIALTFAAGVTPDLEQVHNDHRSLFQYLSENSEQCIEVLRRHLITCKQNMIRGEMFKSLE
ncbi:GntR family transcriptional regulator [Spirochaeta thermophila]|uniref:GntR family transcriptional regulator n=1 Tax=Winmispira thermophila TaxID=154 RepID=UPI0012DC75F5|nr:GntR family transcriptional regulator [Spirochaeta thermophila]